MLNGNNRHKPFEQIVAGNCRILLFQQRIRLRVLVHRASQGRAKACLMRSTIRVVNGIGVTKQLAVVAVIILQNNVRNYIGGSRVAVLEELIRTPAGEGDDLWMQHLFAAAQLFYELLNPIFVIECLAFCIGYALVQKSYFQAGIEERQFAQALSDALRLEFDGISKNLGIRFEGNQSSGSLCFSDDFQFLGRLASLKRHLVHLPIARDLNGKPFRNGIDTFGADAVGSAGIGVAALAIFAA